MELTELYSHYATDWLQYIINKKIVSGDLRRVFSFFTTLNWKTSAICLLLLIVFVVILAYYKILTINRMFLFIVLLQAGFVVGVMGLLGLSLWKVNNSLDGNKDRFNQIKEEKCIDFLTHQSIVSVNREEKAMKTCLNRGTVTVKK